MLAAAGIGSRRECEDLITGGRVEVDGEFVTELGFKVDPASQRIQVDGVTLAKPKRVYFALNKPVGVVSTNSDPDGRPRVIDLIKSNERLYPVGRLDRTSEGLILVTNDGELANRLTHPRYGVEKVYRVRVVGKTAPETLAKIRKGVFLSDGLARVSSIQVKRRFKQSTELEVVLQEGLNREIRRVLARVGHKVVQLKRVAIGPIRLGTMPVGAHRMLGRDEVQALRRATKRRRKTSTESPTSTATKTRSATPAGKRTSTSETPGDAAATAGGDSNAARPRRRKTGSSAMSGYSRPSKKGVKRKVSSPGGATTRQRGEAAQAAPSSARPKRKVARKKVAKKKAALTKPAKKTLRPAKPPTHQKSVGTKSKSKKSKSKPQTGRSGKGASKPAANTGQKKTGRKRRR